jgi:hypothetical protein
VTREKAYEVASALEDIHDFEIFMDEINGVYNNTEGNFDEFYHNELFPLLKKEMDRRLKILEEL